MARRFYQPRRRRMYAFGMSGSDWSRALAVAAFVGSYAALGLGRVPGFRVDRTGVAIIGATAMVVSGRPHPRAPLRHDDRHGVPAPLRLLRPRRGLGGEERAHPARPARRDHRGL